MPADLVRSYVVHVVTLCVDLSTRATSRWHLARRARRRRIADAQALAATLGGLDDVAVVFVIVNGALAGSVDSDIVLVTSVTIWASRLVTVPVTLWHAPLPM